MQQLDFVECAHPGGVIDEAALTTGGIDTFCSSAAWSVSAANCLHAPERRLVCLRGEHGVAALAHNDDRLEPLEFSWCLGSALLGQPGLVAEVAAAVSAWPAWRMAFWPGLLRGSPLEQALLRTHGPFALARGATTVRHVGDLSSKQGGLDGFWSRRSRNLRKNVRRGQQRARAAGVTVSAAVVVPGDTDGLFARIIAAEQHSWKASEGVGLADPQFAEFYRRILRHVGAANVRALFAQQGDRDVGYLFGARFGTVFRGLQFGYAEACASLSLGSVMQAHMIELAAREGIDAYDFGADMDYKRAWADHALTSDVYAWVRR